MVYKKISSKRTNTGYSIHVFVQDGRHVKPIIRVLERYFQFVSGKLDPVSHIQRKIKAEDRAADLQKAEILK